MTAPYKHLTVNHSAKQYVDGMASTNGIESVWALLKRGYYGIYHQFSVKHMQRYVDEFAFRLNEGNCKVHTMTRIDAMVAKTDGVRLTYKALIAMSDKNGMDIFERMVDRVLAYRPKSKRKKKAKRKAAKKTKKE
jgi:effector-binding domain-containing protein